MDEILAGRVRVPHSRANRRQAGGALDDSPLLANFSDASHRAAVRLVRYSAFVGSRPAVRMGLCVPSKRHRTRRWQRWNFPACEKILAADQALANAKSHPFGRDDGVWLLRFSELGGGLPGAAATGENVVWHRVRFRQKSVQHVEHDFFRGNVRTDLSLR